MRPRWEVDHPMILLTAYFRQGRLVVFCQTLGKKPVMGEQANDRMSHRQPEWSHVLPITCFQQVFGSIRASTLPKTCPAERLPAGAGKTIP